MLNRAKPKTRFCSFRLTEEEHQILVRAAQLERRKMADLVHVIVADALEEYARRLIKDDSGSSVNADRSRP